MPKPPSSPGDAEHWRRLGLLPGAPECVLKAAWLAQIELHHPDRGGDAETAKAVNIAYEALRGRGAAANEYVAANYAGEPWVVLGISSAADARLVERAGKQLRSELAQHRRLADRVAWAMAHFAEAASVPRRVRPATPPPQRRPTTIRREASPAPARPGPPQGLPDRIDFGRIEWGHEASRTFHLTWKRAAPFDVRIEAPAPLRADVVASKVLPGRFSVTLSVDWESPEFSRSPNVRGYTLDAALRLRWTSQDEAAVRVKAVLLYPALISASPTELDLGSVRLGADTRASLLLVATAPTCATLALPPWLRRVDAAGRPVEAPLQLQTDTPVRVSLAVDWAPVRERGRSSIEAGRAVRPTGRIVVRWAREELAIPASLVATPSVAVHR